MPIRRSRHWRAAQTAQQWPPQPRASHRCTSFSICIYNTSAGFHACMFADGPRTQPTESVGMQTFTATAAASAQLIHFDCSTRMTSVIKSSEPDSASGCRRASAAAPRSACGQPPAALELPHCAGTPVLSTVSPSPPTAAGWRPPAAVTATVRLCYGRSQPGRQPRQAPWIRQLLTSPGCRGPGCRSCYPQVRYIGPEIFGLLIHGDVMHSKRQAASISSTRLTQRALQNSAALNSIATGQFRDRVRHLEVE